MPAQTSGELVGIVEACTRARASRSVFSRASAHQVAAAASSMALVSLLLGSLQDACLLSKGPHWTTHLTFISDSRHSAAAS